MKSCRGLQERCSIAYFCEKDTAEYEKIPFDRKKYIVQNLKEKKSGAIMTIVMQRNNVETLAPDPNYSYPASKQENLNTDGGLQKEIADDLKLLPAKYKVERSISKQAGDQRVKDQLIFTATKKQKKVQDQVDSINKKINKLSPSDPERTILTQSLRAKKSELVDAKKMVTKAKNKMIPQSERGDHPTAKVALKIEVVSTGSVYEVVYGDGQDPLLIPSISEQNGILTYVLEYLTERNQMFAYSIMDEVVIGGNKQFNNIKGSYKLLYSGPEFTRNIFTSMLRLDYDQTVEIIRDTRNSTEMLIKIGLLELTATDVDRRDYTKRRTVELWQAKVGDPWKLWVSNSVPLLFYDPSEETGPFNYNQGLQKWIPGKIEQSCIGCYSFDISNSNVTSFTPILGSSGSGGGGPMRSDKVDEVDYCWSASDDPLAKVMAKVIGLDTQYKIASTDTLYKESPSVVLEATNLPWGTNLLCTYKRKFKDPVSKKKNAPYLTFPLTIQNFSKTDGERSYYGITQKLKKKQKGAWQLSLNSVARSGVPLKAGSHAERLNAGTVMAKAFEDLGLTGQAYLGPATDFARGVVASDSDIKSAWAEISKDVTGRANVDKKVVEAQKLTIRTDQEWCHLHGHGDGGSEELENFVSGSNHCNTDQLAIETAQRVKTGFGGELTAKITAYIFDSQTVTVKILRKQGRSFLIGLDPTVFPPNPPVPAKEQDEWFLSKAKAVISGLSSTPPTVRPEDILPATDSGNGMYTKSYYQSSDVNRKKYIANFLLERLNECCNLPLPVASVIAYKIYNKNALTDQKTKILHHYFWAQKESFDLIEFNILYWTVRWAVALAQASGDSLKTELEAKAKKKG